eukprot:11172356-Lingulodinium_polyedra.AAC.1
MRERREKEREKEREGREKEKDRQRERPPPPQARAERLPCWLAAAPLPGRGGRPCGGPAGACAAGSPGPPRSRPPAAQAGPS